MGYSLSCVRFPASWVPTRERDRVAAERVALGRCEGAAELDLQRHEDRIYALLRPSAPPQILLVSRPDDPLAHALIGQRWLSRVDPPIDTGHGTPHLVTPAEVLEIAALLAPLDEATLLARAGRLDPVHVPRVVALTLALRTFYGAAAAAGEAVVITAC